MAQDDAAQEQSEVVAEASAHEIVEPVCLKDRYRDGARNLTVALYGNGFNASNDCYHLMLEFLLVLSTHQKLHPDQSLSDQNNQFASVKCDDNGKITYIRRRDELLRRILFNNPFLQLVLEQYSSDEERWESWMDCFIDYNVRTTDSKTNPPEIRFKREALKHIKDNFSSFSQFVQTVELLRSWSMNFDAANQWGRKILFPFGKDTVFCELASNPNHAANDLRSVSTSSNYMTGCGELMFSMLQRACSLPYAIKDDDEFHVSGDKAADIARLLHLCFFSESDPINREASRIDKSLTSSDISFSNGADVAVVADTFRDREKITRLLPIKNHRVFKRLAEDFHSILSLGLSEQDKFAALGTIGMLNLMVYLLEVGKEIIDWQRSEDASERNIDMVIAINASLKSSLHQLSSQRLVSNNMLLEESVRHYAQVFADDFDAHSVLSADANDGDRWNSCAQFLESLYRAPKQNKAQDDDADDENEGQNQRISIDNKNQKDKESLVQAVAKGGPAFKDIHRSYGDEIGLVTRTSRNIHYYYVMSDSLIRCLVYAVLGKERYMLFDDFLKRLYQCYHFVIGPNEARAYHSDIERTHPSFVQEQEFEANAEALKEQMRCLNLMISLSDGFDYVANKYGN